MSSPPPGCQVVSLICHGSLPIGLLRSLRGLSDLYGFWLPEGLCRGLTKAVFAEPIERQFLLRFPCSVCQFFLPSVLFLVVHRERWALGFLLQQQQQQQYNECEKCPHPKRWAQPDVTHPEFKCIFAINFVWCQCNGHSFGCAKLPRCSKTWFWGA